MNIIDLADAPSSPPPGPSPQRSLPPPLSPTGSFSRTPDFSDEAAQTPQLNIRKRRLDEDPLQFAQFAARNVRLKPSAEKDLKAFATWSSSQQMVWIGARLLSLEDSVKARGSGEPQYQIPATLLDRIERHTLTILLSSVVSSYVLKDGPTRSILNHLEKNPHWGLSPEVRSDKLKYDQVVSRIRQRLTQRRHQIKAALKGSLGQQGAEPGVVEGAVDIVALCESLISFGDTRYNLSVSLPMAARIAFLRASYVEHASLIQNPTTEPVQKDFWKYVDASLETIRTKKEQSKERISRFFAKILESDRQKYGTVSLDFVIQTINEEIFDDNNA